MIESEHTQIFRDTGPEMFAINTESISDTSSYFLLADSYHHGNKNQRFRISDYRASALDGVHLRHNQQASVFFLDGHVESAGAQRLAKIGFRSAYGETGKVVNFPLPPR